MKPGYKQTEVGVIPEEWELKPLREVFSLKHGFAFSSDHFSNAGPIVLTPGNFRLDGGLYFEERNIKRYSGNHSVKMIFSKGDLLIVMTDLTPDCNLLGKPAFVESDEVILHNQRIGKVVFTSKNVEPQFLFYLLLSKQYLGRIKEQATGSTVRHTSSKSIYGIELAFPPLLEQRAIAEALSDVDGLLGALDRLIAKKRDLKQAAMQQLLTGQTRLSSFEVKSGYKQTEIGVIPEDWEVKTIDQVGFVTSGKRLPLGTSLVDRANPHPYVRVTDMRPGTIDLSEIMYVPEHVFPAIKRYRIYCEDIFISVAGSLGIVGKVPKELHGANLTENANRIANITCSQDFLLHVLMSPLIQNTIESLRTVGAQPKLALTRIRKFSIPFPTFSEQTAIAEALNDMDAELTTLQQRREKTRALKQGMMQELLTGRIRLLGSSPQGSLPSYE